MRLWLVIFLSLSAGAVTAQRHTDTFFFANGRIETVFYNTSELSGGTFIAEYDSLTGMLKSEGRLLGGNKNGRWRFYDNYQQVRTLRYHHGLTNQDLAGLYGRRTLIYLEQGGFGGNGHYMASNADSVYHMIYATVGGCIISRHLYYVIKLHNFMNDIMQMCRFGIGWKKYHDQIDTGQSYKYYGTDNRF